MASHKQTIENIITVSPRGTGYISIPGTEQEAEIDFSYLNTALHGDVVKAVVYPEPSAGGKEYTGEVLEVLTRAKTDFVGTVKREEGVYFVEAQDNRMYAALIIPTGGLKGAKVGTKVLARIARWSSPKQSPLGEILQVIGPAGEHETEMQAIVLEKGFSLNFPREVEEEADAIKRAYPETFQKEESVRRDLRDVPTLTIDPESAKDFDDALSVRKLSSGNTEIGIHIADVAFFVEPDSQLDKEAVCRGTSIYLVDRTIPMLPEVLSNDLCSLNPEEDKLAFTALFELDDNATVVNRWFGRTLIRSDKRFTYESAQEVLDTKAGPMKDELASLNALADKLEKKREEAGALSFEQDEVGFELDEEGVPIRIYKKPRYRTNKLIEHFMVLANSEVAEFMTAKDPNIEQTFVYRVHDVPDSDKIREIHRMLSALGYDMPQEKAEYSQKDINELLERVRGEAHEHVVQIATIQAMSKAVYSTENIGHFGLSLKHYTHFTSPIRRYPDVMVHRLLARYLKDEPVEEDELQKYEALSRYASQMEITAAEAERASIKYKHAEYMQKRIGEEYDGVITGIGRHGIFVRAEETLTEGMLRLRDLKDDYYTVDEASFAVVGEKTKKTYRIGDAVRVKVISADVDRRQVNYTLAKTKK